MIAAAPRKQLYSIWNLIEWMISGASRQEQILRWPVWMTGIGKKSAGALRAPAQSGVHLSPILVSFSVIFGVHFGVPFGTPIGAETQGSTCFCSFVGSLGAPFLMFFWGTLWMHFGFLLGATFGHIWTPAKCKHSKRCSPKENCEICFEWMILATGQKHILGNKLLINKI